MKYQAKDWTPPDIGMKALRVFYLIIISMPASTIRTGRRQQNIGAYGTLRFNLGAWRLRSDYQ